MLTREVLAEVKENLIVKLQEDECTEKSMETLNIPENCVNLQEAVMTLKLCHSVRMTGLTAVVIEI